MSCLLLPFLQPLSSSRSSGSGIASDVQQSHLCFWRHVTLRDVCVMACYL